MLLFFKGIYRVPILSGEKTDTIRQKRRLPKVGSVCHACVGPSRIFARLKIESQNEPARSFLATIRYRKTQ